MVTLDGLEGDMRLFIEGQTLQKNMEIHVINEGPFLMKTQEIQYNSESSMPIITMKPATTTSNAGGSR